MGKFRYDSSFRTWCLDLVGAGDWDSLDLSSFLHISYKYTQFTHSTHRANWQSKTINNIFNNQHTYTLGIFNDLTQQTLSNFTIQAVQCILQIIQIIVITFSKSFKLNLDIWLTPPRFSRDLHTIPTKTKQILIGFTTCSKCFTRHLEENIKSLAIIDFIRNDSSEYYDNSLLRIWIAKTHTQNSSHTYSQFGWAQTILHL